MREILFKAKRNNWHELSKEEWWVEGLPQKMWREWYIINPDDENTAYPIDPETLCQYTGLKDKNGNRIWENDIIDCHEKRGAAFYHSLVLWNECNARFDVRAMECNFPMTLEECSADISICGLDYQVIGNIFDNPELLK